MVSLALKTIYVMYKYIWFNLNIYMYKDEIAHIYIYKYILFDDIFSLALKVALESN